MSGYPELIALLLLQAADLRSGGIAGRDTINSLQQAAHAIERLRISHERYETVRRMNVPQFRDAFGLSISTGKSFEEIIDELRPFIRPSAAPPADVEGTT